MKRILTLLLTTIFLSSCSPTDKSVSFSFVDTGGNFNDQQSAGNSYHQESLSFDDSTEAKNYLHSQYASLQSIVTTCNSLVVFLQDTAGRSQMQTMNVSMNATNKIKNVDLTQNQKQKIESFSDSYNLMNNICKSLNLNIGRFNARYRTNLSYKSVVYHIYGLEIEDVKDGL